MRGGESPRLIIVAIAVTAAYALTARLGFEVALLAEQVTTVWAPTGIAIAAVILWGHRMWPAVWLGAFLANAGTSAPLWTAALIASGNTLEAVVAGWLLQKDGAFDPSLGRLRDTVRLIAFGAVLSTTISATVGVTTLCISGVQPWARFDALWSAWWLGDALGVLVVAPVIVTLAHTVTYRARQNWFEIVMVPVACGAIALLVFSEALGATFGGGLVHYVVFPLVVATAVRFGQPATSLVVLAVSAVAIWITVTGSGPFVSTDMHRSLVLLQTLMAVMAGTGLLLAASMSERLIGERRRGAASGVGEALVEPTTLDRAAPEILRRVCENLGWQFGSVWLVDADRQELRCYAAWNAVGVSAAALETATRQVAFRRNEGLPGRVWASGAPIWIEDCVEDGNFPRAAVAAEAGVHGAMGCPVRLNGEVVGVIEFFTYAVAAPDLDLLATLATVGNQLGQFIARNRSEVEVAEQQRRTRAILDTALDAVIAMDHRGVIAEFNPAAERMFGYHKEEAIGRELADLIIPPDLRQQHRVGLARHLATGEGPFLNRRVETRGYHADGHEFPIEVSIIRVSDEGPPRFTGFVRDLTERRLAEHALRTSEERFRSLAASNSALTLFEQDRELRYRWVFPQHPEFPDHNIGRTDDELLPGEGHRLTAIKQQVLETGVGRREEVTVTLPTGTHSYDLMVQPRRGEDGAIVGVSGVAVDITERKRTEQLLRESEALLREADRHKDEFLAMLAHELRNPLAPIRTGLELLRLDGDAPDAVSRVRPMMERQVAYMVRLIDDLLDVSRISSGKIHLQRRATALPDLIDAAVEANRAAIEAADLALSIELPARRVVLLVDPTRFVQVLSNLLNNAVKFTDGGGRIMISGEVATTGTSEEVTISIADTGIGISHQMLPRVFEMFTQADETRQRGQAGLGIGLALARRIVEMHGGRIEAHSDGAGTGSTFSIRMPLFEYETVPTADHSSISGQRAIRRRVLVVDDNVDAAEMLASLVRAMGGAAETASDGHQAIERAAAFAPDTIFLDIGMPSMDGYETCRRLRRERFGKDAMIVALTGWGQERDKQRAAEAGFDGHLTKPADPAELTRLLTASV